MRAGLRERGEILFDARGEFGRVAAGEADDQAGLRVVLPVKGLEIGKGELAESGDGTEVFVFVRETFVDSAVEHFLTKFFVIIAAQRDFEGVCGVVADTREIV